MKKHRPLSSLTVHLLLLSAAALSLSPFFWVICASLKNKEDLFGSMFLPWSHLQRVTAGPYIRLFQKNPFAQWLLNSLYLSSLQTVVSVTLCSLGGFALAKYRFAGKRIIMGMMFATLLLPSQVLLPSSYELMVKLGWVDSYLAMIVPGAVSVFGLFLFRQAMIAVPNELLQAGRIDGCSEFRIWWDITLPLVRPMVGAYTLLSFTGTWNSFLWPQIILQNERKYTLPIGLYNLNGLSEYQTDYGVLMAATVLSILPVAVLFFVLQRDFIAGLTSGAVKG